MASKSKGRIPPPQPDCVDANQAIARLTVYHHWSATKINNEHGAHYCVSITHAGRRVSAYRRFFVEAATAAMVKLQSKDQPAPSFMKLAR